MGLLVYDLLVAFDYVLGLTGQNNFLSYVGHSMGTTIFHACMSMQPEYNNKIHIMSSLAPIPYMGHTANALAKFRSYLSDSQVIHGNLSVNLGNELTPTQVKEAPTVTWNAQDEAYYLLCMVDLDAPNRVNRELGEVRHWLVGNIPGNKFDQGETLTEFIGSGPSKGSGLHRYVFLVYKQPGKISFDEPRIDNRTRATRLKFSTRQLAKKYNLGDPVAGNFYQAQYDDYVPIFHSLLK